MLVYLYAYVITQFLLFFVRDNVVVTFLGLNWGLKQAQWTSLVMLVALIPLTYFVMRSRYAQPIPEGEAAATYGIPQPPADAQRVRIVLLGIIVLALAAALIIWGLSR